MGISLGELASFLMSCWSLALIIVFPKGLWNLLPPLWFCFSVTVFPFLKISGWLFLTLFLLPLPASVVFPSLQEEIKTQKIISP